MRQSSRAAVAALAATVSATNSTSITSVCTVSNVQAALPAHGTLLGEYRILTLASVYSLGKGT
jgi:tannase